MQRLADIQFAFRNAVVRGDGLQIAHLLVGGNDPSQRLAIHQRNYEVSLVDALLMKFPATAWLVGTSAFIEAAKQFVRQHTPDAPCIAEYGRDFPGFLSQYPRVQKFSYVRHFAELEWRIGLASIAVDALPIGGNEFLIDSAVLAEAQLALQPGLFYLQAEWPVDELMKLYLTETAPDQFELQPSATCIEVRGARGDFRMTRLDPAEFVFRQSLLNGLTIGDAVERSLDVDSAFDPGQALASLIASGLVTGIVKGER